MIPKGLGEGLAMAKVLQIKSFGWLFLFVWIDKRRKNDILVIRGYKFWVPGDIQRGALINQGLLDRQSPYAMPIQLC